MESPGKGRNGQAAVPHVAEGFADDVGAEVVHLLGALPVVGGPAAGLPLGQHGVDGQAAASVADVGDNEVAVHHVVLLWAGAASQVELVLHRCWLFLIVVSPVKGVGGVEGVRVLLLESFLISNDRIMSVRADADGRGLYYKGNDG